MVFIIVCFDSYSPASFTLKVRIKKQIHPGLFSKKCIVNTFSGPIIGIMSNISKGCYYLFLASSSKQWMVLIMEYTQPDYKWNNKYMQVYVAACLGLEGGVGNIVNRYLEKNYKKRNYQPKFWQWTQNWIPLKRWSQAKKKHKSTKSGDSGLEWTFQALLSLSDSACFRSVLGHQLLLVKNFLFLLSSLFRSLVAEVVDQTELGAVYGLLAIMDAILPYICETTQPFKF